MSERKGDGHFRWYVACAEAAEAFDAVADTRAEALEKGLAKYGTAPFFLIEADKMALDFSVFDAERLLEEFAEHNEMCWGENGMELDLEAEDRESLETHLADALRSWMRKNDCIPPVWCVADARVIEQINACAAGDEDRAQGAERP